MDDSFQTEPYQIPLEIEPNFWNGSLVCGQDQIPNVVISDVFLLLADILVSEQDLPFLLGTCSG